MKDAIIEKYKELVRDAVVYGYNLSINSSLAQKDVISYNFDTITKSFILKTVDDLQSLESSQKEPTKTIKGFKKWANNLGVGESSQKEPAEVSEEEIKRVAVDFFRSWWNSPGNDTDGGFSNWWKINKAKYFQSLPQSQKTESAEEINRVMDYLEGKVVSGMELSEALEISELLLILNKYASLPAKQSDCNHVIGANDESGKCFKCGETVSTTTRYEKRES